MGCGGELEETVEVGFPSDLGGANVYVQKIKGLGGRVGNEHYNWIADRADYDAHHDLCHHCYGDHYHQHHHYHRR